MISPEAKFLACINQKNCFVLFKVVFVLCGYIDTHFNVYLFHIELLILNLNTFFVTAFFSITEFLLKILFSCTLSSNSLGEIRARLNISSVSSLIPRFTFVMLIH